MANKRSSPRSHGPGQFRTEVSSFLADLDEFAEQLVTPAAPKAGREAAAAEPALPDAEAAEPLQAPVMLPDAPADGKPEAQEPAAVPDARAGSVDETGASLSPESRAAPASPTSPEPPRPQESSARGTDILELRRPTDRRPSDMVEFESVDLHLVNQESSHAKAESVAAASSAGHAPAEAADEPALPLPAAAEIDVTTEAGPASGADATAAQEPGAPSWPPAAPEAEASVAAPGASEPGADIPAAIEPSWQPSPITPGPEPGQSQSRPSLPDIRVVPAQPAGTGRSTTREPQRPPRWAPFPLTGATAAAAPPHVDRAHGAGPIIRPAAPADLIPSPAWSAGSAESRRQPATVIPEAAAANGVTTAASTQGRPWALAAAMEPLPPLAPPPARPSIPTHTEANGVLGNAAIGPPQGLSPWVYIGLALLIGGVLVVLLVMGLHHH